MIRRPVAIAITGGIGAGKSETLAAFARHGAATLSADDVVHELIAHDPAVRSALESSQVRPDDFAHRFDLA